jgi:pyruvate/2-oxoglutarate dehydrogenase complex dihydrolipoamide dehydrogenase (E3) component
MKKYDYDLIVIGGGAGGFVASKLARGFGKRVAMVEKEKLGGECTNYGCVPSKALIRVAKVAHELRNHEKFGLMIEGSLSFNTDKVMPHVRSIVQNVYNSHLPESFEALGINVYFGKPQFLDKHSIRLGEKIFSGNKFIIATGSSPLIPNIEGINEASYLTNVNIFSLDELPKSMIVLGGGPLGIELASAFTRLNVEVTVVQRQDRILLKDDRELVEILTKCLKAEGLNILASTKAVRLSKSNGKIRLSIQKSGGDSGEIIAESILIATGRRPNIEGLDLEKAGVNYSSKGILVNERLETSSGNIYACGDVVGPYQFSHMAEYQATIACFNAFLPLKKKVNYSNVIWCTFTDPELAHGGITEEQARERLGDRIRIYRQEYSKMDRARTDLENIGMSKLISDDKGRLVGIHILGSHASEVIHEVQFAKSLNIPFEKIREVIHAYPSYSDAIKKPSNLYYVDKLQGNPFLKILRRLLSPQ